MAELVGNLLVAQSGGPTAVINASVAGVIQEAGRHECVEEIYGGLNGIWGILREELIDLNDEKAKTIEGLKYTPAAVLGTCRYQLDTKKKPEQAARDLDRLFEVFQAHNIRYFFYCGGNDSQDTANKIHHEAVRRAYDLRVIGIPKTIDNDLPHTDHAPGYGSVIKYAAATVMEIAADVSSMATEEGSCTIIEVMGRHAGWVAAGTVLAKRAPHEAPHIILTPEVPFVEDAFLARVREVVAAHRCCVVVVGEGLKNANGEEVSVDRTRVDAFGHPVLSGVAEKVEELVGSKLKIKARSVKLGYAQRAASHFASAVDAMEAAACGEAAVRAAMDEKSGYMVKLVRMQNEPYKWTTDLQSLDEIANAEHRMPRDWISEDGFLPNEKFIAYARPLIQGEVKVPVEGGLPKYVALERSPVEKKLRPEAKPLVQAARLLADRVGLLRFLRPVAHVYNPLLYAWDPHCAYLGKFGQGPKRVLFLGMNPGPFGMMQTGVPFGEIAAVRDWLGVDAEVVSPAGTHPKRPVLGFQCQRSEVSGRRLWGLFAARFLTPENFFANHFVANYCPLAFLDEGGRNLTPDKFGRKETEKLFGACDEHLCAVVQALQPAWVIGIGDFAEKRARETLGEAGVRFGKILHPSPASPAANRDWAGAATEQLLKLGVWARDGGQPG